MVNQVSNSKLSFAEDVAKIKPFEVFGVKNCGVTWEQLFRKHIAFDVLKCGGLDCDGDQCLMNEINRSCNC